MADMLRRRRLVWLLIPVALLVIGMGMRALLTVEWQSATVPHGRLVTTAGSPLLLLQGTPAQIGTATGSVAGSVVRTLINAIQVGQLSVSEARLGQLVAATPPAIREELAALATATGLEVEDLIEANVVVDAQCSAVVVPAQGSTPLRIARNMDFFPAGLLGPATAVTVWRREGQRPVVSIGWPGYAGVVSGMNDAGLTVCILLQHDCPAEVDGVPLAFRLREVLETCATVEEAAAALRTGPPASRHYVLLADTRTACVVWREGARQHRDDLGTHGLAADNGPRISGRPHTERGRCLDRLAGVCHESGEIPTDAQMRQWLSASYMRGINTQAMVLIPALRQVQLATGTLLAPAATQAATAYDLAPVLAGDEPGPVTVLPPVEALPWGK